MPSSESLKKKYTCIQLIVPSNLKKTVVNIVTKLFLSQKLKRFIYFNTVVIDLLNY